MGTWGFIRPFSLLQCVVEKYGDDDDDDDDDNDDDKTLFMGDKGGSEEYWAE